MLEEATWTMWLYHHCNQSIHVTDGMTMMSLSASLLHKISMGTEHLCRIALNRKLPHKFREWCKFSSHFKAKLHKKKSCKTRHACSAKLNILAMMDWFFNLSEGRDNASIIFINSSCFDVMHFVIHIKWDFVMEIASRLL